MSDEIVFYTNPMSRGRIVRWMLEEVGVPYRTEILGYGGTMKAPAYLAINPMGKVPAIVHAGNVVTESGAICAYLADAFPEAGLKPSRAGLADYHRWMFFAAGPVEAAVADKTLGVTVPEDKRGFVGYGNFDAMVDALERAVRGRRYIAGDRFSAADVYAGSQIGWGLQFGTLPQRGAFTQYWGRLEARPAYVRASQIDDEAMAQAQQLA